MQSWRLEDAQQSFVLASPNGGLPEVVYWGPPLPASDDTNALAAAHVPDITGGMLDEVPALSICPEAARSFPGQPGLVLRDANGAPIVPKLIFASEDRTDSALALTYRDAKYGLTYTAHFALDPETHVLTTQASVETDAPVTLSWLAAPVMPGAQHSDEMIDVSGRWCGEFQLNRTPWSPGARMRENRTGRTGHEHFPGLYIPCLLYTSPSPRDRTRSRMPSSA